MKFFKVFLTPIPTIILIISLIAISCADYSEDDSLSGVYHSKEAFNKMNTKEKILHDQIARYWGEQTLLTLRDAVRKRTLVPLENELPYGDMPSAIVTINETVLDPEGQGDNRKKSRFSTLDPVWYRSIQQLALKGEQKVLKGTKPPPTEEQLAKQAETAAAKVVAEAKASVPAIPPTTVAAGVAPEWEPGDLVPTSELNNIKLPLLSCEKARTYFDAILEERRPVLRSDMEVLQNMFAVCKAEELRDFYRE